MNNFCKKQNYYSQKPKAILVPKLILPGGFVL